MTTPEEIRALEKAERDHWNRVMGWWEVIVQRLAAGLDVSYEWMEYDGAVDEFRRAARELDEARRRVKGGEA